MSQCNNGYHWSSGKHQAHHIAHDFSTQHHSNTNTYNDKSRFEFNMFTRARPPSPSREREHHHSMYRKYCRSIPGYNFELQIGRNLVNAIIITMAARFPTQAHHFDKIKLWQLGEAPSDTMLIYFLVRNKGFVRIDRQARDSLK